MTWPGTWVSLILGEWKGDESRPLWASWKDKKECIPWVYWGKHVGVGKGFKNDLVQLCHFIDKRISKVTESKGPDNGRAEIIVNCLFFLHSCQMEFWLFWISQKSEYQQAKWRLLKRSAPKQNNQLLPPGNDTDQSGFSGPPCKVELTPDRTHSTSTYWFSKFLCGHWKWYILNLNSCGFGDLTLLKILSSFELRSFENGDCEEKSFFVHVVVWFHNEHDYAWGLCRGDRCLIDGTTERKSKFEWIYLFWTKPTCYWTNV